MAIEKNEGFEPVDDEVEVEQEAPKNKQEDTPEIEIVSDEVKEPENTEVVKQRAEEERKRETRAQRLKRQRDQARMQIAQTSQEVAQLRQQLQTLQQSQQQATQVGYQAAEQQIDRQLQAAEAAFGNAFDSGDKVALTAAQRQLSELTARKQVIQYARQTQAPQIQVQESQQPRQVSQQQYQQAQPHPLAMSWWQDNQWFGHDENKTELAKRINNDLVADGYDPNTPEFYDEIDKRLAEESKPAPQRRAPVTTGASQPATNKNKIKLDEGQVEAARRLGVPLYEYAKNAIMKPDDKGYTTIQVAKKRRA